MKLIAILILMAGAACAAKEDVLIEADKAFGKATAARGVEGFLSFFDEEGAILPKDGDPIVGRSALLPVFQLRWARPGYALQWTPLRAVLARSGELGYTYGQYTRRYLSEGKTVTETGKYITVWKKQKDGSWKVLLDMGN